MEGDWGIEKGSGGIFLLFLLRLLRGRWGVLKEGGGKGREREEEGHNVVPKNRGSQQFGERYLFAINSLERKKVTKAWVNLTFCFRSW